MKTITLNLHRTLLFISVLLITGFSVSQGTAPTYREIWEDATQTDSIRFQALEKYYEQTNLSQPDSALVSLEYYYALAKEKNATRQMYRALNRKANIFRIRGELEKSKALYLRADELAAKLDNPVLQAIIMGNIGNIYLKQEDYLKATQHYSNALDIFQAENDQEGQARMLSSLGSINLTIGNHDIALEYYRKSLKIYEKIGGSAAENIIMNNMNIGLIEFEEERYENAQRSFERALDLIETQDIKYLEAGCYSLLSLIHLKLEHLEKAEFYARKSLDLYQKLKIQPEVINSEIILAQIIFKTDVSGATKRAEEIMTYLPSNTRLSTKKELYELLYQCYKAQNKLDLSLEMLEKSTHFGDSIEMKTNSFEVVRELIRSDYEAQLNESKFNNQKEKNELKSAQLKTTVWIVAISVILVIALLVYFMSKERRNKERRKLLLEEIQQLKSNQSEETIVDSNRFTLSREKIETAIDRKLNETDWKVLMILLEDPVITNKEIAEKAFMSVDGIGSSLRRMYEYFEIKESKYKKISLLLEAVKISNKKD